MKPDIVRWHLRQDTWNTITTLAIKYAQFPAEIWDDGDRQQIKPEEAAFYVDLSKQDNYT
jgi:hypothetical protein